MVNAIEVATVVLCNCKGQEVITAGNVKLANNVHYKSEGKMENSLIRVICKLKQDHRNDIQKWKLHSSKVFASHCRE